MTKEITQRPLVEPPALSSAPDSLARRNAISMFSGMGLLGTLASLTGCSVEASAEAASGDPSGAGVAEQALGMSFKCAENVAQLRAMAGGTAAWAILCGRNARGDGGGGIYYWDASEKTDDGVCVLNRNGGHGGGWRKLNICAQEVSTIGLVPSVGKNLRGIVGAPGEVRVVSGFWSKGDGGGGVFVWDTDKSRNTDDQGTYIVPNTSAGANGLGGASGDGWRRVYSGELNVRWFGAYATGASDPASAKITRQAIQAALNCAASALAPNSAGGGVIYFPALPRTKSNELGNVAEYVVDAPIVLPRHDQQSWITLRGDGQHMVRISVSAEALDQNAQLASVPAATFVPEPGSSPSSGSYLIEHLSVVAPSGRRAFDWTVLGASYLSARPTLHFREMLFSSGDPPDGAGTGIAPVDGVVRVTYGDRCRFDNCDFSDFQSPDGKITGVAIRLDDCGGTSITNCRTLGFGAMLHSVGGGELTVMQCRARGAGGRPAWDFERCSNITLINLANQPNNHTPAVFRFTDCVQGVLVNPGLVGNLLGNELTNGIVFEGTSDNSATGVYPCRNITVTGGGMSNSYWGMSEHLRMIRINENCSGITVRGLNNSGHFDHDTAADYECLGKDCQIEINAQNGVFSNGTLVGVTTTLNPAAAPTQGGRFFVDMETQTLQYINNAGVVRPVLLG